MNKKKASYGNFKFRNKDDFLEFKDTVQEKLYNNETVFIGEQSIETKGA